MAAYIIYHHGVLHLTIIAASLWLSKVVHELTLVPQATGSAPLHYKMTPLGVHHLEANRGVMGNGTHTILASLKSRVACMLVV